MSSTARRGSRRPRFSRSDPRLHEYQPLGVGPKKARDKINAWMATMTALVVVSIFIWGLLGFSAYTNAHRVSDTDIVIIRGDQDVAGEPPAIQGANPSSSEAVPVSPKTPQIMNHLK